MDLYLCMQQFVAVVRYKSFSRAARHLNLNKPTLSKHIHWLEETHLNTKLLERTTRKLFLTTAGEAYYQQAEKILAEIEASKRIVLESEGELQGTITVAAPVVIHNSLLLPVLKNFMLQHPKIKIHFADENHPTVLMEGCVDILISSFDIDEAQFIKIKLIESERRLFAAPEYIKKYGVPKTPAELQCHRCLINKTLPLPCAWTFENGETIEVSGSFSSNSGSALIAAAIQGLGILWTSEHAVATEITLGLLQRIPCIAPSPKIGLYLYYLPTLPKNRARILAEYLRDKISKAI